MFVEFLFLAMLSVRLTIRISLQGNHGNVGAIFVSELVADCKSADLAVAVV
jgi:hypothetical protein